MKKMNMAHKKNMSQLKENGSIKFSHQNFHSNYAPDPINYPKCGIPFENLYKPDKNTIENLICSICHELTWNARQCTSCVNIFCEGCIEQSIQKSGNKCPLCRKQPIETVEAKILNRFFDSIRINCIHNNCKEKPKYFDYIEHIENCKHRIYHCTNTGCTFKDILANIKYHSNKDCKFRIIECKYCSKRIRAGNFERHEKTECTQNFECTVCHLIMTRAFYWQEHYNAKGENIVCLKGKIEFDKIQFQKYETEIENLKKKIKQLEEKNNEKEKENEKLKNTLKNLKFSFTNIYNNFFKNDGDVNNQKSN
jgi:hypothetical protein